MPDYLTVYPDPDPETNTVDGLVRVSLGTGNGINWASITSHAGNASQDFTTDDVAIMLYAAEAGYTNLWVGLTRSIFLYNTSSLGAGATISAAVMSLYGTGKTDTLNVTPNIDIYTSNPASNTALTGTDFSTLGSTSQTGSPITYANFSTTAYNDFTFDAVGRGNISKTGISKFGARNQNYDVSGVAPTWSTDNYSRLKVYYAEQTGTTNDPKLVVTYELPAGPANLKTLNGVAKASIKTINGVALANIKSWNGVT